VFLDNTMKTDWNKCQTLFYWRHIRHLVKRDGNQLPLEFGLAIHRFMEVYYKGGTEQEAYKAFVNHYQDHPGEGARTLENGIVILDGYIKKWKPERFKVLQVEVSLKWEMSSDLVYCGRSDLVMEYMGDIYIVDHKTTGRPSTYIPRPNQQLAGYLFGSRLLGINAHKVMLNLIGVFKTKVEYNRPEAYIPDWELEHWRRSVLQTKLDIDHATETGFFSRETTQCAYCPYRELCLSEPEVVEKVIPMYYKERRWEPWVENDG
jgi:hypothetical protein